MFEHAERYLKRLQANTALLTITKTKNLHNFERSI